MNLELLKERAILELERLPRQVVTGRVSNRRGLQRLAGARIAKAAWDIDGDWPLEFEWRCEYWRGSVRASGSIDLCLFEGDYHHLLVAVEIVTDRVRDRDLYKLRDAPVIENGGRWIVQLNPWIAHPINRSQALNESISDSEMGRISVIQVWGREYTGLERRQWAHAAKTKEELRRQTERIWNP